MTKDEIEELVAEAYGRMSAEFDDRDQSDRDLIAKLGAALEALQADLRALDSNYRTAQANWDLTLTCAEKLQTENERLRAAAEFTLSHVFDPPNGWYPDDVFPGDPRSVEEQIEGGRDTGPAYVSKSRELLRAALKEPTP